MPYSKGKNLLGYKQKKSTDRLVILQRKYILSKDIYLEDAKSQVKSAIEKSKGRLTELCLEAKLLGWMIFRSLYLVTVKTFLNI